MPNVALIETATNRVVNTIVAPQGYTAPAGHYTAPVGPGAAAGASYNKTSQVYTPVAGTPAPVTPREFMKLFTAEERAAIRASADPQVQDVYAFTMAASMVEFDHPDTSGGLQLLLANGLVTQDRHDRIMAGLPPL